jgi:hypothetical protein
MARHRPESSPDLKPWAAYVVGHHPHSLRLGQECLWQATIAMVHGAEGLHLSAAGLAPVGGAIIPSDDECYADLAKVLGTEVRELEEGLGTLARAGQAGAARLAEMHGASRQFAETCNAMIDAPEFTDPSVPLVSGHWELRDMVEFSQEVVGPSPELQLWRELGGAVGRSQYEHGANAAMDRDFIPEKVSALPDLLRQLGGAAKRRVIDAVGVAVRKIRKPATRNSLDACWERITGRYVEVCRLDGRLRAALRNEKAPEPLLVLTEHEIRFFGVSRPLNRCSPTPMALLWVLARAPGRPMSRTEIIARGRLQTNEDNLKFTVGRLERILKELYLAARRRRGGSQAPGKVPDFIIGTRGRGYLVHPG